MEINAIIQPITSDFLVNALRKMHTDERGWIFLDELRLGTGWGSMQEQRLDGWAIQAWTKNNVRNLRRAFEVKISASDLLQELRDPDKRWPAYAVSHEFYFVTPAGLVKPKLLTKDDGLIEWDGEKLKIVKAPRTREGMPPRWDFVASLARRIKPPNVGAVNAPAAGSECLCNRASTSGPAATNLP